MKRNINDLVTVTLTKEALDILDKIYRNYPVRVVKLDNNVLTIELWMLMHIYGPHLYMGGSQLFVDNEVAFVKTD